MSCPKCEELKATALRVIAETHAAQLPGHARAATVKPAAPDFETWAKAQAEAEQRRQVGRYVVRAGRVVEWEIDNAADERPDGTYALFAASPSPTSSAPAEPHAILARMVELAPFTSFLGAYVNEWHVLIGRAALASSVPPEQQREHKGLS